MNDRDLLHTILSAIVATPAALSVDRRVDDLGVLLTVKVATEDMGIVIGAGGSTAKAIRAILRTYGMRNASRINIKFIDPATNVATIIPAV